MLYVCAHDFSLCFMYANASAASRRNPPFFCQTYLFFYLFLSARDFISSAVSRIIFHTRGSPFRMITRPRIQLCEIKNSNWNIWRRQKRNTWIWLMNFTQFEWLNAHGLLHDVCGMHLCFAFLLNFVFANVDVNSEWQSIRIYLLLARQMICWYVIWKLRFAPNMIHCHQQKNDQTNNQTKNTNVFTAIALQRTVCVDRRPLCGAAAACSSKISPESRYIHWLMIPPKNKRHAISNRGIYKHFRYKIDSSKHRVKKKH